ncbi:hypothetical protein Glove_109g303 [Diversispora epigaea]|uniref:Protein kinase domain-containing protein n=1 Tax=Diversispora epigaea TaxID=1348612 RepID=A0A397JC34_9GLOM|nr:hypothetical protein Glove_109g303 [Diversispora epigaea]
MAIHLRTMETYLSIHFYGIPKSLRISDFGLSKEIGKNGENFRKRTKAKRKEKIPVTFSSGDELVEETINFDGDDNDDNNQK